MNTAPMGNQGRAGAKHAGTPRGIEADLATHLRFRVVNEGSEMSQLTFDITMSLDGFIAGPNARTEEPR